MKASTGQGQLLSRRAVLGSMAGLAGLTLAGCAKHNGGSSGSGSSSGVLNVGQISDSVAFFPLYIAEQNGYFGDAGVKLGERPRLGTGAKVAAALKSGSIDIGAGVVTDAFNLHEIDDHAELISAFVTEYYVDVVVGTKFTGAQPDAPLQDKIKALVGKKIGITGPGSGTEALLTYLFKQIGKDPKTDATLVNLGSQTTGAVGALTSGRVDALSFFQPIGQIVEGQKAGTIYISPRRGDIPSLKGALHGCAFTTTDLVDEKRSMVVGFNKAVDQALKSIHDDQSGTRKLLRSYLKSSSGSVVDALLELLPEQMPASHAITKTSYDKERQFHIQSGLVKDPPTYQEFVPEMARSDQS